MIFVVTQQSRFGNGLPRFATYSANSYQRSKAFSVGTIHLLGRKSQNGFKQTDLRLPDRELRRVHTNRKTTRSRRDVVSRERPLPAVVELAFRCKCKRVSGNRD